MVNIENGFYDSFSHFFVSFIRYDSPFISTIYDLYVILSVIATAMTGSVKTSPHVSKDRLVIIIVDFLPVLIDKLVNSNSAPSLSDDIYPNSSRITKSYFSSFD